MIYSIVIYNKHHDSSGMKLFQKQRSLIYVFLITIEFRELISFMFILLVNYDIFAILYIYL